MLYPVRTLLSPGLSSETETRSPSVPAPSFSLVRELSCGCLLWNSLDDDGRESVYRLRPPANKAHVRSFNLRLSNSAYRQTSHGPGRLSSAGGNQGPNGGDRVSESVKFSQIMRNIPYPVEILREKIHSRPRRYATLARSLAFATRRGENA